MISRYKPIVHPRIVSFNDKIAKRENTVCMKKVPYVLEAVYGNSNT